jgi:hypothetical protein
VPDGLAGPGHGHQPHRAGEIRHVEAHLAVPSAPTSTMPECRPPAPRVAGGVPRRDRRRRRPSAERPAIALGRIDQLAVEIADGHAELALAEIPAVRIGRLEAGEVEDAEVDRSDRHIGLLAGRDVAQEFTLAVKARRG